MTGVYRRENLHPNKWVDMRDKDDCWIKRREGAGWGSYAYVYRREGAGWNQIYPRSVVHIDYKAAGSGNRIAFRATSHNKWRFEGTARQGYYSGVGQYEGFCDIHGSWFEGSGRLIQIDGASFSGVRNGSGYYNNNQNVYFYRSEQHPDENGAHAYGRAGQFVGTTGGPGSGGHMDHRGLNNWQNIMDFVNQVNGKGWLHMGGTGKSADYLGISNISIILNYWYNPTFRVFSNPKPIAYVSPEEEYKEIMEKPYHSMLIYPGEERLGIEEIYERRSILGLKDLKEDNVINVTEERIIFKPSSREYSFDRGIFSIEMFNMYDTRVLEYSFDKVNWKPATLNPNMDRYECPVTENVSIIYLRVIDFKTDELLYENEKELSYLIIPKPDFDISKILSPEDIYKYNK